MSTKNKIFIFVHDAYPLFDDNDPSRFGGRETHAVEIAKILAQTPANDVYIIVEQSPYSKNKKFENLNILSYKSSRIQSSNHHNDFLENMNCDLAIFFGVNYKTVEGVYYCKERGIPSYLFIVSNDELDKQIFYNSDYSLTRNGDSGHYLYFAINFVDTIIVQSHDQQRILKQNFQRSSFVVYNPIDLEHFEMKQQLQKKYALWIGRSDHFHKRVHLFNELSTACPEINFLMIMNKDDSKIFDETLKNMPSNVDFIESVPYAQIPHFFHKSKIYISTASSHYEGYPNAFLQAALAKTPVYSLEVDPDEIIQKNDCGFVAGSNLDSLISQLKHTWENEQLLIEQGQKYYEIITEKHSTESIKSTLKTILENDIPTRESDNFKDYDFSKNSLVKQISEHVLSTIKAELKSQDKIAFFPTGLHSQWLARLIQYEVNSDQVLFIDDNPVQDELYDFKVTASSDLTMEKACTIFLSSDCPSDGLKNRAKELFGKKLKELYEGMPNGPYFLK